MLKLAYIPISDLDPTNFGNFVNNLQKINESILINFHQIDTYNHIII